MFNCTAVFQANYESKAKIVINQGGTASSKTYSIVQLLYLRAIHSKQIITVTGESIPNLKKGAYRDAETIYGNTPRLKDYIINWNKTDRIIYFRNGSIMEFVSNLNEQSAKSGKRDILFVNEANGVSWPIFWQLAIRTRGQIFIDYNPSVPFWAHEKLIGTKDGNNDLSATVQTIISDHRHNCFLSVDEHQKIEGIRDRDLWEVYARGKTGNLKGLVYPDWKEIPDRDFPWDAPIFGGLDFGYTNDPTAGVRLARIGDSAFIHELCYTPGLAPIQIKQIFNAAGFANDPVHCDHDPDQIAQLRRLGLAAGPARKGQGSVNAGIIKMKEFNVYYTASSTNLKEERKRYSWTTDPITGKPTNSPIDEWNHICDASRMGFYTQFFRA